MRLGCLGCLTFLALLAAVVGGVWIGARTLQEPALATAETSAADGVRAQQKILEIAHGKTESTGRVVLTEREVNAFLARHLAGAADLPLTGIAVRLRGDGVVEFTGRLPLRRVVGAPLLSTLAGLAPAGWLERPVWLHVGARPRIEPPATRGGRRHLYLDVERFAVGRQRLPVALLKLSLDPVALRILAWPLPDGIGWVTIEAGQAVLRPASWRSHTGPGDRR
ncbi:MAG: hypothetical protein A3E31_08350 [Candidatus Rokubacteria bacterium RIFCSPHIGHO2_12_FULL_73_22]|nr:MAG: hypothetical protein A3D33_12650 [Candidatus Rokubacteria bacterium RIFCSPHIGHO2_02_FULL_73_26]OGL04196.1 MAG: hypothetical protein A3E31_08350 [Candidatus Rokubacteria bacterium RIFCSPHIGHO2_12_FULL_73_22]OGL09996.1 MAG: hypothetical protein A3I14_17130 [Candidatus Rokubacteria bacterium RIFCSPLOWO2_02_FULL_73_56]OGL20889.1 MAG: hypothetical protein A3G44_16645 [Candidatus Rokubacteria bacterium RIFCSPLOWO2_12_FULL_73_47]